MEKISLNKTKILILAQEIKKNYPDFEANIKIDNKNKKIFLRLNKKIPYEIIKKIELEIKRKYSNYFLEILNY